MRAAGKDDAIALSPPIRFTLEESLEFLEDDELLEVTPHSLRLRKRHLQENQRRRADKQAAAVSPSR
jgi:GTP-binding protein